MNYSRRNPKRSAKNVDHTGTWTSSIARAGTLHKERGANQQFINYTMDLLSVPEYVIKKGRPHGHRYGKKLGDKEYHTADQFLKKCKKKYFQGIHDRFVRDPDFRRRMIKNNRDDTPFDTTRILSTRVPGGFIRTSKVPILCERRTDLTSKRHCQPCQPCSN